MQQPKDNGAVFNENSSPENPTTSTIPETTIIENVGHPEYNTASTITAEDLDVRSSVGGAMNSVTDIINNNLIATRYAAISGVVLLTAYGLSNTPLFFRYRTVSEIPAQYFKSRKTLYYGRIIKVEKQKQLFTDSNQSQGAIDIWIRHLSPIGQILPVAWYDFFMKFSPTAAQNLAKTKRQSKRLGNNNGVATPEEIQSELLHVRIAGIQAPPQVLLSTSGSRQSRCQPEVFLDRLTKDRSLVSLQLLARQVSIVPPSPLDSTMTQMSGANGSQSMTTGEELVETDDDQQLAICRLCYRPSWFQLFATDISQSLIKSGMANVSPSMFGSIDGIGSGFSSSDDDDKNKMKTKIIDSSKRISDIRQDVKYLDQLSKLEWDAARQQQGMWSIPEIRKMKSDITDEIEFQKKANILQKLWRWFRG